MAAAAEVAEQTVYNYFATKEQLVLDRDDEFRTRLSDAVRLRAPDVDPAQALREIALQTLTRMGGLDEQQARGGLAYLSATSPAMRRLCLEMTDRHADALVPALRDTDATLSAPRAKLHATALAWVFQTILDVTGQRLVAGDRPGPIAAELRPEVLALLDDVGTLTGRRGQSD